MRQAVAIVAPDTVWPVMQTQGSIQMLMHRHRAAGSGGAPARRVDLQCRFSNLTVLSRFTARCHCRQKLFQIGSPARHKRTPGLLRRDRCTRRRTRLSARSLPATRPAPWCWILLPPVARGRSRSWHRPKSAASPTSAHLETSSAHCYRCAAACPAKVAVAAACDDVRACIPARSAPLLATLL